MEKTEDVKQSEKYLEWTKQSERSTWSTQAAQDREFKFNKMWYTADAQSLEDKGQIVPTVNELIPTMNQVVADLTRNSPRFWCSGTETSDNKVSWELIALFTHIWNISNGNSKFRTFATDYEDIGIGALMAYVDPYADNNKGEIYICDVDPLELYIDPNSKLRDSSDAAYIMIVKRLTKEQIKIAYGDDFDFEGLEISRADDYPSDQRYAAEGQIMKVADTPDSEKYEVIDRYSKIKVKKYHVYDPTTTFEKTFETQEEYIAWANEPAVIITKLNKETYATQKNQVNELINIARTQTEFDAQSQGFVYHLEFDPATANMMPPSPPNIVPGAENPRNPFSVPGSTTSLKIVLKNDLLKEKIIKYNTPKVDRIKRVFSIGGREIVNTIMPRITNYPIKTGMLHQNRNPFPMGDIRLVRNLQEELNKIDNLIMTYHQNIANISFFVPTGQKYNKDLEMRAAQTGSKVFEYDPELGGTPIVLQYMQMGASFFEYRQSIIQQIQRIIGSYTFNDTRLTTPRTAEGTQVIDEAMFDRTAAKQRDIEDTINGLAKVIAELIPAVYTERKVILLTKPNHEPLQVVFNDPQIREDGSIEIFNDLTKMEYDVQMVSGSTLPTNKAQERAEMRWAYDTGKLINPIWWLRKSNFENVEEIIAGEDKLRQALQQIQDYEEKMKDLEGQLQRKSAEVIQANEKVAVTKTQAKLDSMASEVKSNVLLTKQRLGDEVKNKKKENQQKQKVNS